MRLVLLGSGTPNCEPDRSGPSLALVADGTAIVVDCGPGVVRQMVRAGLDPVRADALFLTHLHGDHTAGLPDLFLSPCVLGRSVPLRAFGPRGTEAMCSHVSSAYCADVRERTRGLEPTSAGGYAIDARDLYAGDTLSVDEVSVCAFAANHGAWHALGYRFSLNGKSVVVSGDTAPYEAMAENYADADVLVHEAYCEAALASRPSDRQEYHRAMHTSALELGRVAAVAKPRLLLLTHQLTWGATTEDLLAEIRKHFAGEVVSGNDLDVFPA